LGGEVQEMLVDGGVGGEFGVESGGEDVAVLDEDGFALMLCKDGDAGANFFEDGAADEDHFERIFFERAGAEEDVARELAAVAVAKNGDVEEFQGILSGIVDVRSEKNRAGTSAEDGVLFGEFADGGVETFFLEELELRGAFAAGEDEAVATLEVGDGADFDGVGAELMEHGGVGCEVALNGENADFE